MDKSNGYEQHAEDFMRTRRAHIGPDVVRGWAQGFPPGATVLELGCEHGVVSQVLIDQGLRLYAVDASQTLLSAFPTSRQSALRPKIRATSIGHSTA
jgi:2-polyprenyl-3-methyl-5-hydroxy-6-metoxy-1,4-benzoquinol methylase